MTTIHVWYKYNVKTTRVYSEQTLSGSGTVKASSSVRTKKSFSTTSGWTFNTAAVSTNKLTTGTWFECSYPSPATIIYCFSSYDGNAAYNVNYSQRKQLVQNTEYSKGTTNYGTVESESRSAYPTNDKSGSYWYVYSHSYKTGPEAYANNGSIKQIQGYVEYNGTVRTCDIYICKDGVIRKI